MGQMGMLRYLAVAAWDFHAGTDTHAYDFFGVHRVAQGVYLFRLFAPGAGQVSLCADFLPAGEADLTCIDARGVWELALCDSIPPEGMPYHYLVDGRQVADPYARAGLWQTEDASVVAGRSGYVWRFDACRPLYRAGAPLSVYRVHLPSYATRGARSCVGGDAYLNYRELGELLCPYAADMGMTHIRLMPLCEHLDGAPGGQGYRPHGYFAPTSRLGSPDDLRAMIDGAHRLGLGVVMDLPLEAPYEPSRPETASFLLSAALYWLREFHLDGLCLCGRAIAWREIAQTVVAAVQAVFPEALMITQGACTGALTLQTHLSDDLAAMGGPQAGRGALFDRLALSLSEVTGRGGGVLLSPLPHVGEAGYLRLFALRRLMHAYAVAHPGGKQLFMGQELGGSRPWDGSSPPEWYLRELSTHADYWRYVRALLRFYRGERRLWAREDAAYLEGDAAAGTVVLTRHDGAGRALYALFHVGDTPATCRVSVGEGVVALRELFNTDMAPTGRVSVQDGVAQVTLSPIAASFWEEEGS